MVVRCGSSCTAASLCWLSKLPTASAVPYQPECGRRMLALPKPDTNGARRVSDSLNWLDVHRMVKLERHPSYPPKITMLNPSGDGSPYVRPGYPYITLPLGFWQQQWIHAAFRNRHRAPSDSPRACWWKNSLAKAVCDPQSAVALRTIARQLDAGDERACRLWADQCRPDRSWQRSGIGASTELLLCQQGALERTCCGCRKLIPLSSRGESVLVNEPAEDVSSKEVCGVDFVGWRRLLLAR